MDSCLFNDLMRKNWKFTVHSLYVRINSYELAEDSAQELWLSLWQSPKFHQLVKSVRDVPSAVMAWLKKAIMWKAAQVKICEARRIAREKKHAALELSSVPVISDITDISGAGHIDLDYGKEDESFDFVEFERLIRICRSLPDKVKKIMYLKLEGYSSCQIAEIMGIASDKAVYHHVVNAFSITAEYVKAGGKPEGFGERAKQGRLTAEQADWIRSNKGQISAVKMAAELGMSVGAVKHVLAGRSHSK